MPYANFRGLLLHTPISKKTHTVNTDQWPVLHFVLGPVHIGPFFSKKITHAKELHQSDRGSCRCHICSLHFGPWILASVDPPAKHIGIWGLGTTNDHQLSYFIIPVHIYHPYSKKHKLPTTHLMEPGRVSMKSFWKQLPPNMVRNKPRNGRLICSTSEVLKIGESHWCHGDTVTKRQKNASKNLGTTRSNKH